MGFRILPEDQEYWSIKCSGIKESIDIDNYDEWNDEKGKVLESAKCGEKIFIENWVHDVILNYQKNSDGFKKDYDDLVDFELKNEKNESIAIQCKCCCEVPYQWWGQEEDTWGNWKRDTPPHRLIRETTGLPQYFMGHYSLVEWTEKRELEYKRTKTKVQTKIFEAERHEELLEYEKAAEIYKELEMDDEVIRVREKRMIKLDQTVVHGDYVDDRDTIIKDSVINRSSIGTGDKFTKLERLVEMKEKGLIDKDEFKQMKKEILG